MAKIPARMIESVSGCAFEAQFEWWDAKKKKWIREYCITMDPKDREEAIKRYRDAMGVMG